MSLGCHIRDRKAYSPLTWAKIAFKNINTKISKKMNHRRREVEKERMTSNL